MHGHEKMQGKTELGWRKSTHSEIKECVELAVGDSALFLRDSTDPDGPVIRMAPDARAAFAAALRGLVKG